MPRLAPRTCLAAGLLALAVPGTPAAATRADTIPAGLQTNIYVAFDLETTGLNRAADRVIEIAAVRFRGESILARTNWLVNPQRPIPIYATRVHGLTDADVAGAPLFKEVYPAFTRFIGDAVLVAHNARFDVGFISAEVQRAGLAPPANPVLDSLTLARHWFAGLPSYSLPRLAAHTSYRPRRSHRALDDALTLFHVFNAGRRRMPPDSLPRHLVDAAGGALHFQ